MKETKFKQTEVGMIPWDWDVQCLGELCKVQNGFAFKSEKFAAIGNTVVRISDIDDAKVSLKDAVKYPIDEKIPNQFTVRKGDFLIAMSGATTGKVGLYLHTAPALINQRVGRFDVMQPDCLASMYLFHLLRGNSFTDFLFGSLATGAQPNISGKQIETWKIPVPPTIEEQQRIANALSDVDSLISNLEKLIAKKKNIKQGAMQQLLTGRKRLPGFGPSCHPERSTKCAVEESSHFKMTELGPIPSDWEVKKFDDVGRGFSAGATPYRQIRQYYEGNVKWVSSGELDYNIIFDSNEHISMDAVKATNLTLHPKGTFLMAITGLEASGTRGRCAILGCEATTNQSCLAIYETEKLSVHYLYHFYVKYGDALAFAYAQGSKQQSFTAAITKKLPIILPSSKAEQTAIANVLSDMDSEIQTLETKLAKYRKLKTGMMQQLLTGKIRLV